MFSCEGVYSASGLSRGMLAKGSEQLKNLGVYICAFFLLIGGVMFYESLSMNYYTEYGPGPGLLPLWTSAALIGLSLLYLVVTIKKDVIPLAKVMPKGEGLINVAVGIGSVLIFIVAIPYTGFIASSTLILFCMFKRGYNWYWSIGLSVVVTLIIFVTFGMFLEVPLPTNDYGW